jgi:thioredoxin reductase (NADPH)
MADHSIKEIKDDINFDNLSEWDVVIIGSGPAGLSAALTTAHRGLTTLVIEAKSEFGGQPNFFYPDKKIVDIPGFPDGILGEELSKRTYEQAKSAMVQFQFEEELVKIIDGKKNSINEGLKLVRTDKKTYKCRKVILAIGLLHNQRRLAILDELNSSLVHYRLSKNFDYKNKEVVVIGGGDSALDAAVMLQERNAQVSLVIREENPIGKASTLDDVKNHGGQIFTSSEVENATLVDNRLSLELNSKKSILCDFILVQIGFLSAKQLLSDLNLDQKSDGSIAIDSYFETSRKGVFAVGDVHGDIKLITVAWAEGIQAAIYAFKEITSPYWLSEKRMNDHRLELLKVKLSNIKS